MGSSRLPGKCIKPLAGKPIIDWVIEGIQKSKKYDGIVVCIPDRDLDEELAAYLKRQNIDVFQGDENDVLRRFVDAALLHDYEHIVRVTADCPFVSGEQIDVLIDHYFSKNLDYAFNHIPTEENFYPDGIGAEICSRDLLLSVNSLAELPQHREHLTLYIREQGDRYLIGGPVAEEKIRFPSVKLDIDTPDDFARMERLLSALPNAAITRPSDSLICEKYLELFE